MERIEVMATEAKQLREEIHTCQQRLKDVVQKYNQLRQDFMGHYSMLATVVHKQYQHGFLLADCPEHPCEAVRRTIDDLKMIEKDLTEGGFKGEGGAPPSHPAGA